MKTKLTLLIAFTLLAMAGCKKKEGCTDPSSLNYNQSAEKNDGSCAYIAGTFSSSDQFSTPGIYYTMTISGSTGLIFTNLADEFDNISGTRNGTSIIIPKHTHIANRNGYYYDLVSGYGTISGDGKTLSLTITLDDIQYGNQAGMFDVVMTGRK